MGDTQLQVAHALQKNAVSRLRAEPHPAVDEPARIVERQRRDRSSIVVGQQQMRLHEHLEPIADSQDQLSRLAKRGQRVGQVVLKLVAQNPSGRNIVAVTKAARNA